jgi:hypothetical protein
VQAEPITTPEELEAGQEPAPSVLRRQIDEQAGKRKEAEARAAQAERSLAFMQAGINPADPKMAYFVKGYDGTDLTPEAIKAAATEAGFLSGEDAPPAVPQGELDAHQRAAGLAAGSTGVPVVDKEAEGIAAINAATSPEEALEIARRYGVRIKNPLDE